MSQHDDLERRLREAFEAKASQVTPDALDRAREREFEEQLRVTPMRRGPRRGVLAGAGLLAAAAATAGVLALTIHPADNGRVIDAARPVASSGSTTAPSAPGASGSTTAAAPGMPATPQGTAPADPQQPQQSQQSGSAAPSDPAQTSESSQSEAPSSEASSAPSDRLRMSAAGPTQSQSITSPAAPAAPPVMPGDLPQSAGVEAGTSYVGPIPIFTGAATYSVPLPSGTEWQSAGDGSYRIVTTAGSVDDFWAGALPGQGWERSGDGWTFPGTSFTVSVSGDLVTVGG